MKNTKIVCTLGPASDSREVLTKLIEEGMDIARLNFSHGSHEENKKRIEMIRELSDRMGMNVSVLLDTKGPEIRVGEFENDGVEFAEGDIVTIVKEEVLGNRERFTIRCAEIFEDVEVGNSILMDDGKMCVDILEKHPNELKGIVKNPHFLKSKKGCNLPNVKLSMPFISEKDDADLRFGCAMDVDYIALSFTRRKEDVLAVRQILKEEGKEKIKIIAKIENQEGYDNLDEILEVVDGVMVARGDLGVDVSLVLVPIYQKEIIHRCNLAGKPVITATHMLESMSFNPRPTRAEASDVANAILDGTDCIMLSGESAAGNYPAESVHTMTTIAEAIEQTIDYRSWLSYRTMHVKRTKEDAIAISVAETALTIDVKCIVVFTESGDSAQRISRYRPKCPIFAVTFDAKTAQSITALWGVRTLISDKRNTPENDRYLANIVAKSYGYNPGDTIIIVAGYPTGMGATNTMRIVELY